MNRPVSTRPGLLFIISAPSGAGKTSLVNALLQSQPELKASISHTTRPRRPGEKDGVDYYFLDKPRFETLIAQGSFLEYAQVFDHFYGTSRHWVSEQLDQGRDVILEIDWQGARQVRAALPRAISIFILPPSYQALGQRLRRRGRDTEEIIERRMRDAVNEISHYAEYDYLLVNDDFASAFAGLQAIIQASRLKIEVQRRSLAPLLQALIA